MSIYDAAMRYATENVPLVILSGREYGPAPAVTGPQRDRHCRAFAPQSRSRSSAFTAATSWAWGVLPLQFKPGKSAATLHLDGTETYTIANIAKAAPASIVPVIAQRADGTIVSFDTVCRLDSETDVDYYRNGGILPLVLRQLMRS